MDKVRIGFIGCGMIAYKHATALERIRKVELVAACSKTYDSTLKFCEKNPKCKPFKSYKEMLESDIDLVTICTPSGNHYVQAKMALEAGKHVVVEKPMCLKVSEADKLIKLAERKGLCLSAISQSRFSDSARAIKKAIDKGAFGKMVSAQLTMRYWRGEDYYNSAAWRGTFKYDGGGVLMNQGIHGIDLLCYLMGKPKSVTGYAKTLLRNIEVEDTSCAAIEFENGAIGVIDATVCSKPSMTKKFIISGEKGTVILENDVITLWDIPCKNTVNVTQTLGGSSASDPKAVTDEYHYREYTDIINHITKGTDLTIDGYEGRMPLSVILGIYKSSKTGRRVDL